MMRFTIFLHISQIIYISIGSIKDYYSQINSNHLNIQIQPNHSKYKY